MSWVHTYTLCVVMLLCQGPVWALCKCGDFLFSGSSDNTIKVLTYSTFYVHVHYYTHVELSWELGENCSYDHLQ